MPNVDPSILAKVMALPNAKGRPQLARQLAASKLDYEQIDAVLAATPIEQGSEQHAGPHSPSHGKISDKAAIAKLWDDAVAAVNARYGTKKRAALIP